MITDALGDSDIIKFLFFFFLNEKQNLKKKRKKRKTKPNSAWSVKNGLKWGNTGIRATDK